MPNSGTEVVERPDTLKHHFETPEQQYESSTLGMWAFLLTEIMGTSVFHRNKPLSQVEDGQGAVSHLQRSAFSRGNILCFGNANPFHTGSASIGWIVTN